MVAGPACSIASPTRSSSGRPGSGGRGHPPTVAVHCERFSVTSFVYATRTSTGPRKARASTSAPASQARPMFVASARPYAPCGTNVMRSVAHVEKTAISSA